LLFARVTLSGAPAPREPLPVATTVFHITAGYDRTVSYLGLVAAGRRAALGFEIPGTIDSLPLRPGTPVAQGDVIATLESSGLEARRAATAAELEQARVELELAQLSAKRQRDLVATNAVSREAYDQTRLRARALEAQVTAVEARLNSIDIELGKSRLLAPYDGVVADRYTHQGAVVNPGVPVVRLVEVAGKEAHIGVAARRAIGLVPGQFYPLRLRDQRFEAELLSVRPDVNPRTRTATAVFAMPAGIRALDGEAVTLELTQTVPERGGWLPIAALQEGNRGIWTVLRINASSGETRTVREAVEVLEIQGERAFVRGTLPDGASVVASGVHRIGAGTAVNPAEGP
jgi:RND family efflux transporter MFP subunit